MLDTIRLRTPTEADIVARLGPWFRDLGPDGAPAWIVGSRHHTFIVWGHMPIAHPAIDPHTREPVSPPEVDERWHADLLLSVEHPDYDAIRAACAGAVVNPTDPMMGILR